MFVQLLHYYARYFSSCEHRCWSLSYLMYLYVCLSVCVCVCVQTLSSLTVENKSETAKLTSDLVLARTQVSR